jgi:glycosyltransferase involved in cell wall biosynthesis
MYDTKEQTDQEGADPPHGKKNRDTSKLNILQIAPIYLPITGKLKYAGIERLIYSLDKHFCESGHMSTIAASKNSEIKGKLLPIVDTHLWDGTKIVFGSESLHQKAYHKILSHIKNSDYDVIHTHDPEFVISGLHKKMKDPIPVLVTMHGPIKNMNLLEKNKTKGVYFNTISRSQCSYFSSNGIKIDNFVYNGINIDNLPYQEQKEDYLLVMGRISRDKGQDIAIKIAKKLGLKLILTGPVHDVNKEYYQKKIKPNVDGKQIIYKGEISTKERNELYAKAKCFLMPIQWEEPFGLVVTEAMACGTPVVAFNRGAMPEIMKNGKTGYIVNNEKEMIEAIKKVDNINPRACRKWVEKRFTSRHMTDNYLNLYRKCIAGVIN